MHSDEKDVEFDYVEIIYYQLGNHSKTPSPITTTPDFAEVSILCRLPKEFGLCIEVADRSDRETFWSEPVLEKSTATQHNQSLSLGQNSQQGCNLTETSAAGCGQERSKMMRGEIPKISEESASCENESSEQKAGE